MKIINSTLLALLLFSCAGGKTRQQLKHERIAKQEDEWKKKEELRLKDKNTFRMAKDYSMKERFYFDNKWAVSVFDGKDTSYMKFPTADMILDQI